jgi:hypothetical protein
MVSSEATASHVTHHKKAKNGKKKKKKKKNGSQRDSNTGPTAPLADAI